MKKLKWLLIPIVLVAAILVYININKTDSLDPFNLIPNDALYIVDTEEPIDAWEDFSEHEIWKLLKTHESFKDLAIEADYLDSLLQDNQALSKLFRNNRLVISAHPDSKECYDFAFIVELQNQLNPDLVRTTLTAVIDQSGYSSEVVSINSHDVIRALIDEDLLHFVQFQNQLVCSYSKDIITSYINQSMVEAPVFNTSNYLAFNELKTSGNGQVYIQYNMLNRLLSCYLTGEVSELQLLADVLQNSAFNVHLEDNEWLLEGLSTPNWKDNSLFQTVLEFPGKDKIEVSDILSNRTAWFTRIGVSDIGKFLNRLQEKSNNSLRTNQKRLELLLGISLERDFFGWMGPELAVGQLNNPVSYDKSAGAFVAFKAANPEKAKEGLKRLTDQIRKRTPIRNKTIDYRSSVIYYTEIPHLFNALFGKYLDRIDKPHFCFIGSYVVFSNSPLTLISMIEDYENGHTLSNQDWFSSFYQKEGHAISTFVSPQYLYKPLLKMAKSDARESLKASEAYFKSFSLLGLTLHPSDSTFKTAMVLRLETDPGSVSLTPMNEIEAMYNQYARERDVRNQSFRLEWIEDGVYTKRYPGSEQIEIEADTKDGIMHGKYYEYHRNGEIRIKGKYKNGRKTGTWKYYNDSGKQTKKTRF